MGDQTTRFFAKLVLSTMILLVAGCASRVARKQKCVECGLRLQVDEQQLALAKQEFSVGCAEGDAASCSVLGVMYEEGQGVEQNFNRAAQLYESACREENTRACFNLGRLYARDEMVDVHRAQAIQLLSSACNEGFANGCFHLGVLRLANERPVRAREAFRAGCKGGDAAACYRLATLTERGEGKPPNKFEAAALYRSACLKGVAIACDDWTRTRI